MKIHLLRLVVELLLILILITWSANGNCSARGLANVGAFLANNGTFGNVTLLPPSVWKGLHGEATLGTMLGYENYFTQGWVVSWIGDDVRAGFL